MRSILRSVSELPLRSLNSFSTLPWWSKFLSIYFFAWASFARVPHKRASHTRVFSFIKLNFEVVFTSSSTTRVSQYFLNFRLLALMPFEFSSNSTKEKPWKLSWFVFPGSFYRENIVVCEIKYEKNFTLENQKVEQGNIINSPNEIVSCVCAFEQPNDEMNFSNSKFWQWQTTTCA